MAADQRQADYQEILRQAERMLAVQYDSRESALRRAGELLRLGIAVLGGVIVIGGIIVTTKVQLTLVPFTLILLGVVVVGGAVAVLATVLVAARDFGYFAYGPELERAVEWLDGDPNRGGQVLESFARVAPALLAANVVAIAELQKAKNRALRLLVFGSLCLLVALVYILGGAISG